MTPGEVLMFGRRFDNAQAIVDCGRLGYVRPEWRTLDATYGRGMFWKRYHVDELVANDLFAPESDRPLTRHDFRRLPYDREFDVVVFDPPYKLNGTSTGVGPSAMDIAYGVARPAPTMARMGDIRLGIESCARATDRMLLVKVQDQVVSGRKVWQTRIATEHAEAQGFRLVDQLHVLGHRPQPFGRRQLHARQDYSTLLILARTRGGVK